jgi:HSP20 family protein
VAAIGGASRQNTRRVLTMTLIRRSTSPFGELLSLRQAMDRLFEDSFVRPRSGDASEPGMPLDVYTTPDALVVEAALPGVKPEDVEISLLGDQLTLSATTQSQRDSEDNGYLVREVRRGSFSRSLTLPQNVKGEAANATFENGILRLSIPKAEEAKPRQIRITPTTEGTAQVGDGGGEAGNGAYASARQPSGSENA